MGLLDPMMDAPELSADFLELPPVPKDGEFCEAGEDLREICRDYRSEGRRKFLVLYSAYDTRCLYGCQREYEKLCAEDTAAVLLRLRGIVERGSEWIRSMGVHPETTCRIQEVLWEESVAAGWNILRNFAGELYYQFTYKELDVYTGRPMKACMEIDSSEDELDIFEAEVL